MAKAKKKPTKITIDPIVVGIRRSKARYALSGKRPGSRPMRPKRG